VAAGQTDWQKDKWWHLSGVVKKEPATTGDILIQFFF
jgi:hypothetical protein